jgi:hypothetical protein
LASVAPWAIRRWKNGMWLRPDSTAPPLVFSIMIMKTWA